MTPPPIRIRPAQPEDLDAILRIWSGMMTEHQAFDPRVRLAEGAAAAYRSYLGFHLASSDACIRVAEAEERGGRRVAGFCLLLINRNLPMFLPARYGYLSDLAVDPAWRRRGIGKALLAEVKGWLAEKEISTIQLQVYSKNAPGAEFWRAAGFGAFYDRLWLGL